MNGMFSFIVSSHLEKHPFCVSLYLINVLSNDMCLGAKSQNIKKNNWTERKIRQIYNYS